MIQIVGSHLMAGDWTTPHRVTSKRCAGSGMWHSIGSPYLCRPTIFQFCAAPRRRGHRNVRPAGTSAADRWLLHVLPARTKLRVWTCAKVRHEGPAATAWRKRHDGPLGGVTMVKTDSG